MKIALVLSGTPGYSETFFANKISGLINKGFHVELFVDHADPEFKLCPQHSLPGNNLWHVAITIVKILMTHPLNFIRFCVIEYNERQNFKEISKSIYSCLHLLQTHGFDWIHFGFATMSIGRENIGIVLDAKLAVSFRGFDITRYPLKHPGCYNLLWKRIHRTHAISNSLLRDAIANGLPTTVSSQRITPAIDIQNFLVNQLTLEMQHPVRFLTVARLHWVKGIDYSLEAMQILKRSGISFRYTIVGDGVDHNRLILAADQLGVSDCIYFTGKIPHEELKKYYEDADIYIQYSVQEGFCNAVLEAQAMGLPSIVSDAGGLPENVIDCETGWIVPRRQPALLAEKIAEIIKMNKQDLLKIRHNAMEHVKRNFSVEQQHIAFEKFYYER